MESRQCNSSPATSMRSKSGNSSNGINRMGAKGSSHIGIDRLSFSSTDRLSRLVRSRRGQVLLLFVLVVGGLLLSSMTLSMHQSSSSIAATEADSTPEGRLHFVGKPAAADSAAAQAHVDQGGVSQQQHGKQHAQSDKAAAIDALQALRSDRRSWRWKSSKAAAGQRERRAAATNGQAGLSLPTTNLLAQLAKQPPAEVTAAALYKVPASQTAAALALPEDLSLILAAEQTEEQRRQPQQQQKSLAAERPAGLQEGVDPYDGTSVYIKHRGVEPTRLKHPLWWHGPVWSGSGYGSEAVNYVLSLLRTGRLAPADIWAYHHGDAWREHVVNSMSEADRTELEYLQSLPVRYRHKRSAVVVCHSVATNWAFPEPMWQSGAPCPPNPKEFAWVYAVGRTMFETDRLHSVFVPRLNALNEIWVPSAWQRQSFIQSGVDASKLVVVPEGVNTSLYDPALYTPLALRDKAQLVFGRHWEVKLGQQATAVLGAAANGSAADLMEHPAAAAAAAADAESDAGANAVSTGALASGLETPGGGDGTDSAHRRAVLQKTKHRVDGQQQQQQQQQQQGSMGSPASAGVRQTGNGSQSAEAMQRIDSSSSSGGSTGAEGVRRPYRFISTFKWEERKGWSILLEAYLTAFTAEDDVELYILTQPFGKSGSSFKDKMRGWASKLNITQDTSSSSSSGAAGRSLLNVHPNEQQGEEAASSSMGVQFESKSEDQRLAAAAGPAAWAAHVGSVVQQIEEFAEQLQHKRRHLQGMPSSAAAAAGGVPGAAAAQRQLHQASSAKAAGTTTETHPQLDNVPAFTKTAAAGTPPPKPLLTAASQARARLQQRAASQAARVASDAEGAGAQYPTLYVVDSHISDADFPRFYKAGDAFVLPSRGEGWGRPHVEAMSMGLPVVSTNWSGVTAYLDETVGYPIAIDGLVPVAGGDEVIWWFHGLKWAQPSVKHLAQLMRHVYMNREEAAAKGAAARARMIERYSPEAIADLVVRELQRIQDKVP